MAKLVLVVSRLFMVGEGRLIMRLSDIRALLSGVASALFVRRMVSKVLSLVRRALVLEVAIVVVVWLSVPRPLAALRLPLSARSVAPWPLLVSRVVESVVPPVLLVVPRVSHRVLLVVLRVVVVPLMVVRPLVLLVQSVPWVPLRVVVVLLCPARVWEMSLLLLVQTSRALLQVCLNRRRVSRVVQGLVALFVARRVVRAWVRRNVVCPVPMVWLILVVLNMVSALLVPMARFVRMGIVTISRFVGIAKGALFVKSIAVAACMSPAIPLEDGSRIAMSVTVVFVALWVSSASISSSVKKWITYLSCRCRCGLTLASSLTGFYFPMVLVRTFRLRHPRLKVKTSMVGSNVNRSVVTASVRLWAALARQSDSD